jgi:hypothetical protein
MRKTEARLIVFAFLLLLALPSSATWDTNSPYCSLRAEPQMVTVRASRLKGAFLNRSAFIPRELRLDSVDAERLVTDPLFLPFIEHPESSVGRLELLPERLSSHLYPSALLDLKPEFAIVHSHGPTLRKVSTNEGGEFDFGPIQPGTYAIREGSNILIVVRVQPARGEAAEEDRLEFNYRAWDCPASRVQVKGFVSPLLHSD